MAIAELTKTKSKPRQASVAAASSSELRVVVAESAAQVRQHVNAWQDLADHSLAANVFYEPWMLLPAFEAFADSARLAFIYAGDRLHGFFPMQPRSRYKRLPVKVLSLWKHLHCYLCTPLIRSERASECLATFFDWAKKQEHAAAVEFNFVQGDGAFERLLIEDAFQHHRLAFEDEKHVRALLERAADGESYLQATMSTGNRKELRRQRKRLGEVGKLELRTLERESDLESWLEQFLALEAAGWKHDTALRQSEAQRTFFLQAARAAFERGRLMMLGLSLDGRFIAMKCNFLSAGGAFAYKIAFDESFNRFSPGVQLEIENILAVHARPDVPWMDSCAVPNHFMINRLWKERRTIQTLLVSTGDWRGDLLVSALPMLRWAGRLLRRKGNLCSN